MWESEEKKNIMKEAKLRFNIPANTEPKNNVVATLEKTPNNLLLQKPLYITL